VGCRQVLAKRSLIRIVRTPQAVRVDPTGKLSGRGAYLHDQRSCWEKGLKGPLAHALKTELEDQDLQELTAYMMSGWLHHGCGSSRTHWAVELLC
jgi:predicted RNA-binding protein YlxR (DUF448 family)